MKAVWSDAYGRHIPFDMVQYALVDGTDVTVYLVDGNTSFFLQSAEEFLEQWYAWLHRDLDVDVIPAEHPPAVWGHEEMRQYQDEHRGDFKPDTELRKRVRQMQGGFDVV